MPNKTFKHKLKITESLLPCLFILVLWCRKKHKTLFRQTLLYLQGLFPARYVRPQTGENKDYLDSHHTHFVFIDGTKDEVVRFRHNFLDYLGNRPIEFDSTRTKS